MLQSTKKNTYDLKDRESSSFENKVDIFGWIVAKGLGYREKSSIFGSTMRGPIRFSDEARILMEDAVSRVTWTIQSDKPTTNIIQALFEHANEAVIRLFAELTVEINLVHKSRNYLGTTKPEDRISRRIVDLTYKLILKKEHTLNGSFIYVPAANETLDLSNIPKTTTINMKTNPRNSRSRYNGISTYIRALKKSPRIYI